MRVAATVAADDRGVSVLRPVGGVPMVVRAVRCVLDAGVATHVILDVTGYYREGTAGAEFFPVEPVRLLDTRSSNGLGGMLASSLPESVRIADRGGIPDSAIAVTANATVTNQTSAGYVAIGPTETATPTTSV